MSGEYDPGAIGRSVKPDNSEQGDQPLGQYFAILGTAFWQKLFRFLRFHCIKVSINFNE